ncbi:hypothetical protein FWK45_10035 [Histophilus somni]|uniref:Uncharacterized protein n=1 Tax=Histophilus somni TaxID=731 RepID=A0A9Q6K8T2_HISSO|nr:hypothetical protein [Histophilus somni]ARU65677.1 hypothetical protein BTV18_09355 [Histophilus somni]ARU67547.1 hypothetical protein BTV19_09810 [Histophilus somni]ARU69429.1 hypothetical protein BTV16_09825 [Histophilus somni]ARU71305.1 hypothetical protein BTV20_09830 [Histophilus somni]ARU73176.1 hypothetical protein BTV17_09805 [Histophilus somni]
MKKFIFIISSFLIVACSNTISLTEIGSKMLNSTEEKKSVIFNVPSTGDLVSDLTYIGMVKTIGSNQVDKLSQLINIDNINIGIAGKNSMVNKAVVIAALNKSEKVGKNTELYMIGSLDDKDELEKLALKKQITLHYFPLNK